MIPFGRDATELPAEIRPQVEDESATRERIRRSTHAETGWYRTRARAKR